ncbi:MAG: CHC2 zinc finger domain-containing protein [Acidimicrobiales bacterium]
MGILDEDIQRVREATDIVAVIGEHVQLKRVGRRWQGLCPFHGEKSPSFSVNAEEGLYYCFGCQAKGDAITFVREIERLDFVGGGAAGGSGRHHAALHRCQRAAEPAQAHELYDAVEAAVAWYHDRLLSGSDAGERRRYLRSRGFDGDDVRAYRLRWAPDAWDTLAKALKLPDQILVDAGSA